MGRKTKLKKMSQMSERDGERHTHREKDEAERRIERGGESLITSVIYDHREES